MTVLSEKLRARAGRAAGDSRTSAGRKDWSSWPVYEAAADGLRNYWYPVQWSSRGRTPPGGRPRSAPTDIVLMRDELGGACTRSHDRCPHRGVPLSLGKEEFPGTITCAYHGWTYRLSDGELVAVITDGPDSPICGKVRVRTLPGRRGARAWSGCSSATRARTR